MHFEFLGVEKVLDARLIEEVLGARLDLEESREDLVSKELKSDLLGNLPCSKHLLGLFHCTQASLLLVELLCFLIFVVIIYHF